MNAHRVMMETDVRMAEQRRQLSNRDLAMRMAVRSLREEKQTQRRKSVAGLFDRVRDFAGGVTQGKRTETGASPA